jgi:hypothetical protein
MMIVNFANKASNDAMSFVFLDDEYSSTSLYWVVENFRAIREPATKELMSVSGDIYAAVLRDNVLVKDYPFTVILLPDVKDSLIKKCTDIYEIAHFKVRDVLIH